MTMHALGSGTIPASVLVEVLTGPATSACNYGQPGIVRTKLRDVTIEVGQGEQQFDFGAAPIVPAVVAADQVGCVMLNYYAGTTQLSIYAGLSGYTF